MNTRNQLFLGLSPNSFLGLLVFLSYNSHSMCSPDPVTWNCKIQFNMVF